MKPAPLLLLAALAATALGQDSPPVTADGKTVVLAPFKVHGVPIMNFAIDIRIFIGPETKKVSKIVILEVKPHSDASVFGLQEGDEIVKIDGNPVEGMDPTVEINSQLGKILLNRTPGDQLRLEVQEHRTVHVTLRAQSPGASH
jgi:membrane-associated protease RseP (regulator of RpoE activity)